MTNKPRRGTIWENELRPEELMDKKVDGGQIVKTVLLKGLQRLAEEAGIKKSFCNIISPRTDLVQCVYNAEFDDGTHWVGAGDCTPQNTQKPFSNYATAIAESRAEARCLRKALGIKILSSEEIDFTENKLDINPNKAIDSSVIVAIEQLCESKNINKVDLLNEIIKDKKRANSIFEFKQLTLEEGQFAMQYLNSLIERKKSKK